MRCSANCDAKWPFPDRTTLDRVAQSAKNRQKSAVPDKFRTREVHLGRRGLNGARLLKWNPASFLEPRLVCANTSPSSRHRSAAHPPSSFVAAPSLHPVARPYRRRPSCELLSSPALSPLSLPSTLSPDNSSRMGCTYKRVPSPVLGGGRCRESWRREGVRSV